MNNASKSSSARDNESLTIYLKEINRIPLLSHEEETELAVQAKAGSKKAREKIINANLRFVVSVAKKYAGQGMPLEDLINEGNIGLITALDKFEPDKGYHFISYAVWWIRQSILKALSEKSRAVRLPLNRANELMLVQKARNELILDGSEPTMEELSEATGLDRGLIRDLLAANQEMVSFDSPRSQDSDSGSVLDTLEDPGKGPEEMIVDRSLIQEMDRLLLTLTDKEREVIKLRFGFDGKERLSLKEIGERFGLTKERIRQIEKKALDKLRAACEEEDIAIYSEAV